MINLDALKIVLFDFDDTLAIWNTHKCGEDDAEYVRTVLDFGTLTWQQCKPNKQMKQFMQMCKDKNIRMGLISKTCTVLHMHGKQQWVKENYGFELENFCVSEMPFKLEMLKGIEKAYGYQRDEIAIIDDFYEHTTNAANNDFCAYTPMEIVNFINDLEE